MKTIAIRLTSRALMIFAVVALATGAVFVGVANILNSFDQPND